MHALNSIELFQTGAQKGAGSSQGCHVRLLEATVTFGQVSQCRSLNGEFVEVLQLSVLMTLCLYYVSIEKSIVSDLDRATKSLIFKKFLIQSNDLCTIQCNHC